MAARKRAASDEEGPTVAQKRAITRAQRLEHEQAVAEELIAAGRGALIHESFYFHLGDQLTLK